MMKTPGPIKPILFIFFAIQFISCEMATKWEISPGKDDFIVVSGQITNEKKEHIVTIYGPVDQLNKIPQPISGGTVSIFDGDSLYQLNNDYSMPGRYTTNANFRAVINKTYTLLISVDGQNYFASTTMLPVSQFDPLNYKYDETKQMFFVDSVAEAFNSKESAMYEILINWEQLQGYDTIPSESKNAVLYYYTLSTLDVSEVFKPQKEQVYFPAGTTIIERKYSLTKQQAKFIRSLLLETEWRGGLFDVAQGNITTNLSNGAFGYFGASSVLEKTITVK
jgi:hypothetical protein